MTLAPNRLSGPRTLSATGQTYPFTATEMDALPGTLSLKLTA